MRLFIVAVYDAAAEAYGRPVFVNSMGQAERSFLDELRRDDPVNEMFRHPSDFSLFDLGTWDDQDGFFTCDHSPRLLSHGRDIVVKGV